MTKRVEEQSVRDGVDFNTLDIYGERKRVVRMYRFFTVLVLMGLLAGIFILWTNHNYFQMILIGSAIPLLLVSFFLINRTRFELVSIFLAIILFTLITVISTSGQGIHAITNLGFPAVLIIASLVMRKRTLALLTGYAILCIAWLVFGELLNWYTPKPITRSVPGDFFTVMLVVVGTAVMVRILSESLFTSHLQVQRELRERRRAEERLAHDALHDALTGLPNRILFLDRLGQRLEHARRNPDSLFAVMYIDLDRIKVVNDSLGHAVGDKLLIEAGRRLSRYLRPEDTVARLGGDEFAILVHDLRESREAIHIAERIQSGLSSTPMIKNVDRITTASIGITVFNKNYARPNDLMRDADSAMYRAKAMGGGHYVIFDDTMHFAAMTLLKLEADLKHAVERNEWQVYYQPIVRLPDRCIESVEALVRWNQPKRGIVSPAEFIRVAEETGLILPMGEYVLSESCRQTREWQRLIPGLSVSVNLSSRQFQHEHLLSSVEKALESSGFPGKCLQLEITESSAMKDPTHSSRVMTRLDKLGIRISLDDFGSGYSSLAYLNSFPIRILKIGQSFTWGIGKKSNSESIIRAIISMGHALGMQVVAEGVQTEKQVAFLESSACDLIQGHLVSPALPAAKLEKLLVTQHTPTSATSR